MRLKYLIMLASLGAFAQSSDPSGSDTKPAPLDPATYPRCIKDLQAAFLFHTDISSVPRMKEFRAKASEILGKVTDFFTIPDVKNIDIDDDTCEFNKDQMEAKTLFYGSIYLNDTSIGVDTFCFSNMNSYPGTVQTADYKQSSQVNLQSVIDTYAKWYNSNTKMMCHCFDYQNPNTTKIMLWMPLSPASLDTGAVSFKEIDTVAHFQHIVVPFGFNYRDSPVWRQLVPEEDNWLTDVSKGDYNVLDIVQDIWTITCRLAGRIDESSTAEPYYPFEAPTSTGKPVDNARCIDNLQAAYLFHNDISSVPRASEFRYKAKRVIELTANYFTIPDVKNIDIDDDTCEFNTDQMEDKTLIYGSIYANSSSIGVDTFCLSNMNSYPNTVATADYKQAPQVNLQSVIDSYAKWYNSDTKMMCHCFDYKNPKTTKIMVWMPFSPTTLDSGAVSFKNIDTVGFKHIVVPFGFNYEDSAVWQSLVPDRDQWIEDASRLALENIVQDIWTVTCRLAGRIGSDQTAEPIFAFPTQPTTKPIAVPTCIKDLQAAIAIHSDISSVPRMTEFRGKIQKIVESVSDHFTVPDVPTIDIGTDMCEFNRNQMRGKTLFHGTIYANGTSIGEETFCSSNMATFPQTIRNADYKQAAKVNLQSVIDSYSMWYNSEVTTHCHCFDYQNPNTTKIIVWTPLSPTSLDTSAVSFKQLAAVGFNHIVVPFGFSYKDSLVWRLLVPDASNWLDDASRTDYDVDDIIQDIWAITCRVAGRCYSG